MFFFVDLNVGQKKTSVTHVKATAELLDTIQIRVTELKERL